MGKLLRVLMRVLARDWLYAMTSALASANTPTDGVDDDRSFASVYGRDARMFFRCSSIPCEHQPNTSAGLNMYAISLACQTQRHDYCGERC